MSLLFYLLKLWIAATIAGMIYLMWSSGEATEYIPVTVIGTPTILALATDQDYDTIGAAMLGGIVLLLAGSLAALAGTLLIMVPLTALGVIQ